MWVNVVHIASHYIRSGQSPGKFKTRVFTHSHHHPCRAMLRIGYVAQQTVIITLRDRFVRFSNWWGGMNLGSDSIPPPSLQTRQIEAMRKWGYTRVPHVFFFLFYNCSFRENTGPQTFKWPWRINVLHRLPYTPICRKRPFRYSFQCFWNSRK
jgi:hypothetical protein